MSEIESSVGKIVGLFCFSDGESDKPADFEVRFIHASDGYCETFQVGAGAALQAFASFTSLAVASYLHGLEVEVYTPSVRRGSARVITGIKLSKIPDFQEGTIVSVRR